MWLWYIFSTAYPLIFKIWLWCIFSTAYPLIATKLCSMVHHHEPECLVKRSDCHAQGQGQRRFRLLMNVCPANILWTIGPFVTKLGAVMHHHELEFILKDVCAILMVKVAMRTCVIKIQLLLYLLNFWTRPSLQSGPIRWFQGFINFPWMFYALRSLVPVWYFRNISGHLFTRLVCGSFQWRHRLLFTDCIVWDDKEKVIGF